MGQVTQEVNDFGGRLRHLRHHRHLAKIGVAQQLRFFLAQCQDFVDQRGVVKLAGIAPWLVRKRVSRKRAVELFTQIRTLGELHDRQVARHLQRELVAIFTLGLGSGQRSLLHIGRYAFQFFGSGVVGKGIRRIQGVFAELLAQLCLALLDLREALFGGPVV